MDSLDSFSDCDVKRYADQLVDIARWAYRNGWAPGTSTNYSLRLPDTAAPAFCAITSSGVDKESIDSCHIIPVDRYGRSIGQSPLRPSAETPLHLMLYRTMGAGAVFHTHSMAAALLSRTTGGVKRITLSGWELLKGLDGIETHDCDVVLPVFPNSQDIPALAEEIESYLSRSAICHGFILAGHGLYVWGKDLTAAKRHLEVFEFLLQCEREVRSNGHSAHA